MRLLNVDSLDFTEFDGQTVPPYIIASHRWFAVEPTYKDVKKGRRDSAPAGYAKMESYCDYIQRSYSSFKWLWIDTVCIDKSSSAELSYSINSMFQWYATSQLCLVYLADVPNTDNPDDMLDRLRKSQWFRRGWTLQELLAPKNVVFLNAEWNMIGTKDSLLSTITEVTGIPAPVLVDYTMSKHLDVTTRLQWMQNRFTTRTEDMSYCLMGIFDVHIPLVYGEGENARKRLLREIELKTKEDKANEQKLTSVFTFGFLKKHFQSRGQSSEKSTTSSAEQRKTAKPVKKRLHKNDDAATTLPLFAPTEQGTALKERLQVDVNYPHRAKTLFRYKADPSDPNEFSFERDEIFQVRDTSGLWWLVLRPDGREGIAPSNYLSLL